MRVLVTGADGLLGSNVVRTLLDYGHTVGAFIQKGKKTPTLDNLQIVRFEGDLLDQDSLVQACTGFEAVIHIAAYTSVWPSRSSLSWDINLTGTNYVINAATLAQIDRLICIGTANSFTPGTKEAPGDEKSGFGCKKYGLDYIDSKYAALNLIRKKVAEIGLPALVIHPTFMIGPYDSTPSSGVMLMRLYEGKIIGYTHGGKSWTYVGDVATAIVHSLTLGVIGESYIAGNWNLSYKEFFELAAEVLQVPPPKRYIPKPLAIAGGCVASALAAVTKKPPMLSYHMAKVGCDGHYYSSKKAHDVLQMPQTDMREAVLLCMQWLLDNGYVTRRGFHGVS